MAGNFLCKMDFKISEFFSKNEIKCIEKEAHGAEKDGQLTESMLTLIRDKELLQLFVPQAYGGLQCPLPKALKWLEATSWLDGSLGWTLTLGSGAGLFGAYMQPPFAKSIFADNNLLIAGSGFPGGKAEVQQNGYLINGEWKYATGIDHATLVTATCYLTQNGKILYEDEEPVVRAFAFYPNEINWDANWKSYGLQATGSHSFKATNLHIPNERVFQIQPSATKVKGPLYRYPFEAFAHATLAISLIGMARRFLNEAEKLIRSRKELSDPEELSEPIATQLKNAKRDFQDARNALYHEVEYSWEKLTETKELNKGLANRVSSQSRKSCKRTLKSTEQIYPFLGMAVIDPDSVINRCWRDMHTASQHMLLTPKG